MIAFAFALIVVAMVYTIGHISGCQINPAITVALAVTGKLPWREVPGYLAAQLAGAVVGAATIVGVLGRQAATLGLGITSYGGDVSMGRAFFAEAVGTFVLAFVVFGVIERRAAAGFAGLAIGLAVFSIIIPVAPATGASLNPARAFGPMLVGQLFGSDVIWRQLPVYVAAEIVGACLAGTLYGAISHTRAATRPAAPDLDPAVPAIGREGAPSA
jgi:glycerol uptake facilitator protein